MGKWLMPTRRGWRVAAKVQGARAALRGVGATRPLPGRGARGAGAASVNDRGGGTRRM